MSTGSVWSSDSDRKSNPIFGLFGGGASAFLSLQVKPTGEKEQSHFCSKLILGVKWSFQNKSSETADQQRFRDFELPVLTAQLFHSNVTLQNKTLLLGRRPVSAGNWLIDWLIDFRATSEKLASVCFLAKMTLIHFFSWLKQEPEAVSAGRNLQNQSPERRLDWKLQQISEKLHPDWGARLILLDDTTRRVD